MVDMDVRETQCGDSNTHEIQLKLAENRRIHKTCAVDDDDEWDDDEEEEEDEEDGEEQQQQQQVKGEKDDDNTAHSTHSIRHN